MKKTACFLLIAAMLMSLVPFSASAEEINIFASGYNRGRGENDLIVYTPAFGASTNTNVYGREAIVDSDGKIISVNTVGNSDIPAGGFVISGHGTMSDWVWSNCKVGQYCSFNQNSLEITISDSPIEQSYTDMFYKVEKVFDGMNTGRNENQIIVYTSSGLRTGTNEWGYEVVVQDGRIISVGGNNNVIPQKGFVLSGHGDGQNWLGGNAKVGMKASFDELTRTITVEMDDEAYLQSIDLQIDELNTKYTFARENFLYCDYEYISSSISEIDTKRKNYSSLETAEEQGKCITELTEMLKKTIAACGESRPVEYRGVWVIPTQKTQEEVSDYVQRLYDAGINTVSVETLFNSTLICTVPEGSLFEHNPDFEGFDVLQAYIVECHNRGMELHVWMPVFCVTHENEANTEKSPWYKKPEWRMINDSGKDVAVKDDNTQYFLNPAHPEVQDFLLETYRYIIETYDIDGFELDYIRYPSKSGDDYGYDEITVNGFKEKYGVIPKYNTNATYWENWAQYRCDIISDFVSRLNDMMDEIAPDVILAADVGTSAESAPEGIYQDFSKWAENGDIDLLKPMSYSLEAISETDVNVEIMNGRYLAAGVGAYSDMYNSYDVANHVNIANQCGADGVMFFEGATYLGKECADYLLETGAFRNRAVTPSYDPAVAAETVLDYAVGRINEVIIAFGGISDDKCADLKTKIESAKTLVAEDKSAAMTAVEAVIAELGDSKAETALKGDLEYFCKILENSADTPRTPPEGPSVNYDPESTEAESEQESEPTSEASAPNESEPDKSDDGNSGIVWVCIGIVAAVILAAIVIVVLKKKK